MPLVSIALSFDSVVKKVLLVIVDALSARHVQLGLNENRLPNFQRIIDAGEMNPACISIFPSITPAATASIITGKYPSEHQIPGAFFYDTESDHVFYFGTDIWNILREGLGEFFNDFVVRLNEQVLSAETLFQKVERSGLRSASLNYLVIAGDHPHKVDVPWLLSILPGVPWREEISGPEFLCLGDMVASTPHGGDREASAPGGLFNRFGFQDDSTAAFLKQLAEQDAMRDLTVAYFPDNDFNSHEHGPMSAIETLENVDKHLGDLLEIYGGIDAFLETTAILITGDHSQSNLVTDEAARGIQVETLLQEFRLVPAGKDWADDSQLMVCPNMRACQIYLRGDGPSELNAIIEAVLSDHRIDQVIWRVGDDDSSYRYHVAKADMPALIFWRCDDDAPDATDVFGNQWCFRGSLDVVDAQLNSDATLKYGDYPNALDRITGSFAKPIGGDVWVTARVGHEFLLPAETTHGSGSHGSLHADDSMSPLICAGAPDGFSLPEHVRTIDVANFCLRILDVPSS